ncbi:MAG: RNA 2',3'-cyclic phosphodiesterase [Candidatus Sumerlaeia bacterium]|nr:RNA 2',3'-cyclic phosphodiesterase [Candidatus Sumerlaeia bacterium]
MAETPEAPAPEGASHRLFFAIDLPRPLKDRINELVKRLDTAGTFTGANPKWVSDDNFHITLWFIGNVDSSTTGRLKAEMRKAVRGVAPFTLDLRHLGYFPTERDPSVLWLGAKSTPAPLSLLRTNLAAAIRKSGVVLPVEQKFTPHVTLARLRGTRHLHDFTRMMENYRHAHAGTCEVREVVLMESHLRPGGAEYRPYATQPFPDPEPPES